MYSQQTIAQQRWARQAAVMRFNRKNLNAATTWRADIIAVLALITLLAAATAMVFINTPSGSAKPGPILAKSELNPSQLPQIQQPKPEQRRENHNH